MLKKLLPIFVLVSMVAAAWMILNNPPKIDRSPRPASAAMTVEVQALVPRDYPVIIERYGRVLSAQRTRLIAEASGRITYIADQLRSGGRFKAGDLLLKLDDATYQAELVIARANLAERLQSYSEQQALAEQAQQAWLLSGQSGQPGERTLRKPQLEAAKAQVESARNTVQLAEIALAKSRIYAPFDGAVASLSVDVGQAISNGSEIAELVTAALPEVEVALHQRDLAYLELDAKPQAEVILSVGDQEHRFTGRVIRAAAELDEGTQQLMVRLKLDQQPDHSQPLVGSLTQVQIRGRMLEQVLVVPNSALYQSRYVYLVKDKRLQRHEVALGWQDDAYSVVTSGLNAGDNLVITPMGQVSSGTLVDVTSGDTSSADVSSANVSGETEQ